MIKVHALSNSRALRVLWLLEELNEPYEVIQYQRDPVTLLAPPELKNVHPLGKSPVIEFDGRVLAESGAILEILLHRYGKGRLQPKPDDPEYTDYLYWMHFAEGSAMPPLILALYVGRLGDAGAPLQPRINGQIADHLQLIENALQDRDWLLKSGFSAADIQVGVVAEFADLRGRLATYPKLKSFVQRSRARPAHQRAAERGGQPFAKAS